MHRPNARATIRLRRVRDALARRHAATVSANENKTIPLLADGRAGAVNRLEVLFAESVEHGQVRAGGGAGRVRVGVDFAGRSEVGVAGGRLGGGVDELQVASLGARQDDLYMTVPSFGIQLQFC